MMGRCQDGFPCVADTSWSTQIEFVAWLARQSDKSLSGNQGITLKRLNAFLQPGYSKCRN